MSLRRPPLDLGKIKVYPLTERRSMSRVEEILVDPEISPAEAPSVLLEQVAQCACDVRAARARGASVLLFYGAHLVKNGASLLVDRLMEGGWVTHLATNGAGAIHDWEFAYQAWSTESVRDNVATGTFGTWDETGRYLHLAVLAGALREEGIGRSVGRMIAEDGLEMPRAAVLRDRLREEPEHPLTPARAEILQAMMAHQVPEGWLAIGHPWKHTSIFGQAFARDCGMTVHPGIGYDIISNHPMFNGAALGRGAGLDFRLIGGAIEGLNGGVVLSVGSAIMAPQVFEKSLSCVNNLRRQDGRAIVEGHSFYVVDLQDGGQWDWTQGEPPKDHPAYYLRFCKSFYRMGGVMHYVQSDNVLFLHHLVHQLRGG